MSSPNIKSGSEVVSDFLDDLKSNLEVDAEVVAAIRDLVSQNRLTQTQLGNKLADLRQQMLDRESKSKADPQ